MIYRTLGELRSELATRLGFGAMGSAGINSGLLNSFLQNAQDQLFADFQWRHLITYDEKTTGAGQSLYDWAEDCDPSNVTEIAVNDGVTWTPMTEGIDWMMRSDDTQFMPQRYERFAQMEVWPVPDTQYTIRRYYVRSPDRFTQDNDRASIDDGLILLHAITNAKQHYQQKDGANYATQLNAMLIRLKGRSRSAAVSRRSSPPVPPRPRTV